MSERDRGYVKDPKAGKLNFTPEERKWIGLKWSRIRKAQQKADASNKSWNRINDELNSYLDRQGIWDVVQRAKIKGSSLPLADALGAGKWHAEESQRHIADVNLFLRLKELEIL